MSYALVSFMGKCQTMYKYCSLGSQGMVRRLASSLPHNKQLWKPRPLEIIRTCEAMEFLGDQDL